MKKAFLPGSFDPPTHGHINLIRRASKIFDELYVVISVNEAKKPLFSIQERVNMLKSLTKDFDNVHIEVWRGLIVNFAIENDINLMVRGVRALSDFGYEFELAMTNKGLMNNLEVVFLPTDPQYFVLRSSAIKEIASFGGNIEKMVPPIVAKELKDKLRKS